MFNEYFTLYKENEDDSFISPELKEVEDKIKEYTGYKPLYYLPLYDIPYNKFNPIKDEDTFFEESQLKNYMSTLMTDYTLKHNTVEPSLKDYRGLDRFNKVYDQVEKDNPEAKKYRSFLTKVAAKESGFRSSIQNLAGAPAYGYFQFMQDGKKYNNISVYAGTDIKTFRSNPKIQIEAAIKLAKEFENSFSSEDLILAKQQGITMQGLLGGAWLAGVGGVRRYLKGLGNPSDRKWSKSGRGTDVKSRINEFNL